MNEVLAVLGNGLAVAGDAAVQILGYIMDYLAENPDVTISLLIKAGLIVQGLL